MALATLSTAHLQAELARRAKSGTKLQAKRDKLAQELVPDTAVDLESPAPMTVPRDRIVLFLGAGFSAPWGIPTMPEFVDTIKARLALPEVCTLLEIQEHYERTMKYYQERVAAQPHRAPFWKNIETLFTRAEFEDGLSPSKGPRNPSPIPPSIAWTVWDVCRRSLVDPSGMLNRAFRVLVHDQAYRVSVITTNYDVLVEQAISTSPNSSNSLAYHYPLFEDLSDSDSPLPGYTLCGLGEYVQAASTPDGAYSIPLVKLHGSVNWFGPTYNTSALLTRKSLDKPSVVPERPFACNHHPLVTGDAATLFGALRRAQSAALQHQCNISPFDEALMGVRPFILPPGLRKKTDGIQAQWQAAAALITEAAELWIIGCGFPTTDMSILLLLSWSLERAPLRRIRIVNNSVDSAFWTRMTDLFSKYGATLATHHSSATDFFSRREWHSA